MTDDELDKEEIRLKSIYDNLLQNAGPSEQSLRILNEIWNIQSIRDLKRKIVETSRDMSEDKLLDFGPYTCSCGKCERCVGKIELLEFQSLYGHLYEKIKSLEEALKRISFQSCGCGIIASDVLEKWGKIRGDE